MGETDSEAFIVTKNNDKYWLLFFAQSLVAFFFSGIFAAEARPAPAEKFCCYQL